MKLEDCLYIGRECGLSTVGEAVLNVMLHAVNIFSYSDINEQLEELYKDKDEVYSRSSFTDNSKITQVLEWVNNNYKGEIV